MSKALVAYFSASGVTSGLAKKLASSIGADIFEIVPVKRYTPDDLNWRDKTSRSSIEMNDKTCRPAISTKADIAPYDIIFLGFPIWWFREPSIIDTFVESYDFSGKTIVPFATSGGTDIGSSGKNISELVPDAKVEEGKRFSAEIPADKLKEWASAWI